MGDDCEAGAAAAKPFEVVEASATPIGCNAEVGIDHPSVENAFTSASS